MVVKTVKSKKHIHLGCIIYFRVGFLILLFTYVNLYLLVSLFILPFIVLYGGNKGVDILYLRY